jgi:hypothetical protein
MLQHHPGWNEGRIREHIELRLKVRAEAQIEEREQDALLPRTAG